MSESSAEDIKSVDQPTIANKSKDGLITSHEESQDAIVVNNEKAKLQSSDIKQQDVDLVATDSQETTKSLASIEKSIDENVLGDKIQQETGSKNETPNAETTFSCEANKTTSEIKEESSVDEHAEHVSSTDDDNRIVNEATAVSGATSDKKKIDKNKETLEDEQHAEHVTYTEDGTAIYTDPKTNYQYKWCMKENKWLPNDAITSKDAYENEHYKWCNETQKWVPKQTQLTETEHYKWDAEKNQWIPKIKESAASSDQNKSSEIVYDIDKEGQRTYTDTDGMVYFWDVTKNAWFPKIDDDFMARYQMSYGFIDNTSESEKEKEKRDLEMAVQKEKELAKLVLEAKANEAASKEESKQACKRKQPQEPPKWFEMDPAHNTKVYVTNLPSDITLDEFADFMGKCGMIMRDPQTQKYKIKLYTESDGQIKGDGLCDYIKVESVDLALKILDEYDFRGHKIRVQRAQFQMRGEYNPALKPKRKKKDKEKLAKIKEKLFDWRPEKMRGERSKHEKTVIIKNLFHPDLFEKEVQLILDYQNDLREECGKCGTVRKVVIYDRHSEGVAQVNMSSPEEADLVIQMMQGRFFGKRQLTAEHWDGKTKFKIEETEDEIKKRLNKWDQYLEAEENKKSDVTQKEMQESLTDDQTAKELSRSIENQNKVEETSTEETNTEQC